MSAEQKPHFWSVLVSLDIMNSNDINVLCELLELRVTIYSGERLQIRGLKDTQPVSLRPATGYVIITTIAIMEAVRSAPPTLSLGLLL